MEALIPLVIIVAIGLFVVFQVVTRLITIATPNEVIVFSGPSQKVEGKVIGYRYINGGSRIRVPLVEKVSRLDVTNMIIEINISGAYSKGGIPLNVQAVANVKIASSGPVLQNALRGVLGKSRAEVMRIAKETLEGNLRGVLATLTPEQVNEDKQAFAQSLLDEAEHDLSILGLVLDTLSIQNVTDDQGYLQAIGRRQAAELQARARSAEARTRATAIETQASDARQTALAQLDAQLQIAAAEVERRIKDAESKRFAVISEQESEVAALLARTDAEVKVQLARIEQIRRKLNAEVIEPSRAQRDRLIAEAQGAAARTIEDGRARASAMHDMATTFSERGEQAKQILLAQQLDTFVRQLTSLIHKVEVDSLTLMDGGSSEGGSRSLDMTRTIEELKATTGIDVPALAASFSTRKG
jgi:flotillin